MTDLAVRSEFGTALKEWRSRRRLSQLALATDAGVSQRHISFMETGRAKPSREMVVHLGAVLDVPLRDRNAMLASAGFAPVYSARSLDDPELAEVRAAFDQMLQAHNPFPAYIVDRAWNLTLTNESALRLVGRLPRGVQEQAGNVVRLVCHPDGLRTVSTDWTAAASVVLRRLRGEVAAHPHVPELAALLDEAMSWPDAPDSHSLGAIPSAGDVLIPLQMVVDGRPLSFFTTITSVMGPVDVTLEELRLETLLPADDVTSSFVQQMME